MPHPKLSLTVLGGGVDGGAHRGLQLPPALLAVAAGVRLPERLSDQLPGPAALALDGRERLAVLVTDALLLIGATTSRRT